MSTWKIAAVQMDCRRTDKQHNLHQMKLHLRTAAKHGAGLDHLSGVHPLGLRL